MGKLIAKSAIYCVFIHFLLVGKVVSRHLQYNAVELVSDGFSDESILRLKGSDSSEEECKLMYGFLPCSTNIPSHIFLIVIYEYLLYHGESYAGGDGRIFRVLGKNFYVSIFSQLLDSLPDSLILLATGLSCDQEKAQEYVLTGAGLLAGSSVLLLTLLWGTCFVCSRRKFTGSHSSSSLLAGWGVHTDPETSFHATVMFYSLIPFVIILFPSVFGISYSTQEHKIVLLVSLSAAVICLISYFCYQCFEKKIWIRRLEYAEVEQKVEMHVPFYEVQALMMDREKHLIKRQKDMEQMLKTTENDKESTMSKKEFHKMFEEWLDDTKKLMDDPYSMDKKETEYNQVVELLLEDKNKWIELMSFMMEDASGEKFLTEDGTPNESAIYGFFDKIDIDKNGHITPAELEAYYQKILLDDEIAEIIMRHLDIDGNGDIDKEEFKSGVKKWLASRNLQQRSQDSNLEPDKYHRTEAKAKTKEMLKAIILLIVGILMITFLAEPLVESVRQFSESVKIEPFYVSFILVPLATNARTAIAAIRAASQKRHHTTSFTFSEIYHKVFLNNILGFCVLVSVIYFRGFTWHFSAEILVVVIVCIIMGLLASLKSKFPDWTLLIAFPLYPLSMVVVYFVNDAFQFT
ncbi:putative sodium/calcium exchanger membrane region, EF-hand domain pair, mitochondrial Rho GTPase [Helianthus annuus]|uniref:Putative sodium/calcium exchanger membrane region, EF-hand domain pair n=1 Tax=Helianthus annuus TaxID=4232 RepID=A0A251SPC7_HELAN|nr:sodium/calcium exchanger NCL2 [Helianthus annuus]KAF5771748.1 putative sodium/calcium exchanger membrane region, EF-hand domain pair, mitochondrial Rho GTPase [Helianthus annuus]